MHYVSFMRCVDVLCFPLFLPCRIPPKLTLGVYCKNRTFDVNSSLFVLALKLQPQQKLHEVIRKRNGAYVRALSESLQDK